MGKIIPWIAVAIAVLFMTKGDKPIQSKVRGLRNNNPGNLRPTGARWAGQVIPGTDPGFMQFTSMPYGIRALFVDLVNKHKRGLDTLREILYVYAPPSENRTESYISNVSAATGIDATQKFEPTKSNLFKIAKAFARVENGPDALLIPDKDWNEGWRLANQRADIKSYVK